MFCALSNKKVYGPFFFPKPTVSEICYLDKPINWLFPELEEDHIFQQKNLLLLKARITAAIETVTSDMLLRLWDEFDYHVDVQASRRDHSEHVKKTFKCIFS